MFANILSRFWWMMLLRGLIWILFGIMIFARPSISLVALIWLFGAFAFADGVINLVHAIFGRKEAESWWLLFLAGVAGIGVGALTFARPGVTGLVLLFYIAIWAIVTGVLEIVEAIRLRKQIENEVWLVFGGLVSVALGVLLMARPGAGALGLLWAIGAYAIVFGASLVVLSIRARGFTTRISAALAGRGEADSAKFDEPSIRPSR